MKLILMKEVKNQKNEENDHKKLSVDQIVERERRKTKKHLTEQEKKSNKKGLVDFNNFIRDEVGEPGQKRII